MKTDLKNKNALMYFKLVEKELLCSKEQKVSFLHQLEGSLLEYSEENPDATAKDYETHFGNPTDAAEDIVISFNEGGLKKKVEKSKFIKTVLMILIALVIIIGIAIAVWNANTHPKIIYDDDEPISENINEWRSI